MQPLTTNRGEQPAEEALNLLTDTIDRIVHLRLKLTTLFLKTRHQVRLLLLSRARSQASIGNLLSSQWSRSRSELTGRLNRAGRQLWSRDRELKGSRLTGRLQSDRGKLRSRQNRRRRGELNRRNVALLKTDRWIERLSNAYLRKRNFPDRSQHDQSFTRGEFSGLFESRRETPEASGQL
jgi:hypothetical protein